MNLNPATFNEREKVLYQHGLALFHLWRSWRAVALVALLGNVVQWWVTWT